MYKEGMSKLGSIVTTLASSIQPLNPGVGNTRAFVCYQGYMEPNDKEFCIMVQMASTQKLLRNCKTKLLSS